MKTIYETAIQAAKPIKPLTTQEWGKYLSQHGNCEQKIAYCREADSKR